MFTLSASKHRSNVLKICLFAKESNIGGVLNFDRALCLNISLRLNIPESQQKTLKCHQRESLDYPHIILKI